MFLPINPLRRLLVNGLEESDLADDVRRAAARAGIEVITDPEPERNAFVRSDLAARGHPRVRAVVAIGTYDYDRGRGARRASALARLLFSTNDVPVLGGTVMRLRQYAIVKAVLEGGLHRLESLPGPLAREMYSVGNRPGHYQAFMSLVHHWPTWEAVRERYGDIDRPVLLLYGDHDWSRPDERAETARLIPGAEVRTVKGAGHFLSFDAPAETIEQVFEFVERRSHS
jgi:pimeloyl-ACP methyl ester carboxylesterase